MFVSLLRSIMANHYLHGGILQDTELTALGDSILNGAQYKSISSMFIVGFSSRSMDTEGGLLERTVVLSDMQMGTELVYIFWALDPESDTRKLNINWHTMRLLLCLACVYLIDTTTFGIILMELYTIGGVDIIKDILNTSLGTTGYPFLSIYSHGVVLLCIILGFIDYYTQFFKDCISPLKCLKLEACAYRIYENISSSNPSPRFSAAAPLSKLLTISDVIQILLVYKRAQKLLSTDLPSCRLSDVKSAVDQINNLINMELSSADATIELISACVAKDGLVFLVAEGGSQFCHLARCFNTLDQAMMKQPNTISELAKHVLDKFYAPNALVDASTFTHKIYIKAYKRILLINVVFSYIDNLVHLDVGQYSTELINFYSASPASLQYNICLCIEASGHGASPILNSACYLDICVHALDHTWQSLKDNLSFISNVHLEINKHMANIIKHIKYATKRYSKAMCSFLQDIKAETPQYITLKRTVITYFQLIQVLTNLLVTLGDSLLTAINEPYLELFNIEVLQTVLLGAQSLYILHCLENKNDTQVSISFQGCSGHENSTLSERHTIIQHTTQLLLLLFRHHLYLTSTNNLNDYECNVRSKLFSRCFAFLFSLYSVLSIADENHAFLSYSEEINDLLCSFVPTTNSASQAFLTSLLPFIIISLISRASISSNFVSLYFNTISQLYDSNPLIQFYYKLICRVADSCHIVIILNQPLHIKRSMFAYIMFRPFLVQINGEEHRLVIDVIDNLYIKDMIRHSKVLFYVFSSTYIPSLSINLYLPLVRTAVPPDKLCSLCIESKTPIMARYPRLSVQEFIIVTSAVAILSCVDDTIASVLFHQASLSSINLSDSDLQYTLTVVIMFLVVLHVDIDVFIDAKTLKKLNQWLVLLQLLIRYCYYLFVKTLNLISSSRMV